MLKISKQVEYAILAIQHIATNNERRLSAKEIAMDLSIDFDFLAKTLQLLKSKDIVGSKKGKGGGYELLKSIKELTVAEVIMAVEKIERIHLVDCLEHKDGNCGRTSACSMRLPFLNIQNKINSIFDNTTIKDMIDFQK